MAAMDKNLVRRLKARLTAAQLVLSDTPAAAKDSICAIQGKAVLALLTELQTQAAFSDEVRADVSMMIARASWSEHWMVTLLEALNYRHTTQSPPEQRGTGRRSNQLVMPALLSYFNNTEWGLLLSSSIPAAVRMEHVYRRMLQLNARNPTERCIKELAALWMTLDLGEERVWHTDPTQRADAQDQVRTRFRAMRKSHAEEPGTPYPAQLPGMPHEFKEQHPQLWKSAFATEDPVPCRLRIAPLQDFASSWDTRGGISKAALMRCATATRNAGRPHGSPAPALGLPAPALYPALGHSASSNDLVLAGGSPSAQVQYPRSALQALSTDRLYAQMPPSP